MKILHKRIIPLLITSWMCVIFSVPCFAAEPISEPSITLTEEEKSYIAENPNVSIAIDTSWIPYGFKNDNNVADGIIIGVFDIVAQRAGLTVDYICKDTYMNAIAACRNGETMLVSGIANDPAMAKKNDVNITAPYITIHYSAVTRTLLTDLYKTGSDYRVAICVGTYAKVAMQEQMPTFKFVEYANNQECMEAVLNGETEIALIADYAADYFRSWHEYKKLQSVEIDNFSWQLGFGVNKQVDPLLISILNKSIATLTTSELNQSIYNGTLNAVAEAYHITDVLYEHPYLVIFVSATLVALLCIIVVLIVFQRYKIKGIIKEQNYINDIHQKDVLLNSIPAGIGIVEISKDGIQTTHLNDYFFKMLGDNREHRDAKFKGQFLLSVVPEDKPLLQAIIEKLLNGDEVAEVTYRTYRGDGTPTWIHLIAVVAERKDKAMTVFISIAVVDEQLHKTEAALATAKAARKATSDFFSRMSHDMRTPMNGILGMVELSENENDSKIVKENLGKIKNSSKYLLGLINDTLDFQRIESGKLSLKPEIVSSASLVRDIMNVMKPATAQKNIDLREIYVNTEFKNSIFVDPLRYKQIFMNLLSNSLKFTPAGGTVELVMEVLRYDGKISHTRTTVRDTGYGMSEDFVKNKLFQPFNQEQNGASGQYAGSGLGLSIVKNLVELMGGHIEVESELGVGSSFSVYLDFQIVNEDAEKAAINKDKMQNIKIHEQLRGKNILLAEDNPLNAEISEKLLEKVGCSVTWAHDGKDCLEQFEASTPNTFDLILMDIRMPNMNGLESATAIRNLSRADAKSIPIVAMTANAFAEDVKTALNAGMNAHIAKPIDPNTMYQTLAQYIVSDTLVT